MNNQEIIARIEKELTLFVETPHLDAVYFVDYYERHQKEITEELIDDFIQRRKQKEPVSKIIQERGFWSLDLKVSKDVLDPRPDTETLIEAVLSCFKDKQKPLNILDIATGSGCILLSLLSEYKNATGVGIDVSKKALKIASENASMLQFNPLFIEKDFYQSDFCDNLPLFDIIVSNPPYIPTKDVALLDENVRLYDPILALDGGLDGLNAYRALSKHLHLLLKKEGMIFFEIGINQENDVKEIMQSAGYTFLNQYKDLGGIVRILSFKLNEK